MPYTRTTLTNNRSGRSLTDPSTFRLTGQGRAKIKSVDAPEIIDVSFPFGPRDIKIDNRVAKTVQVERPGKKPILAVERPSLLTVSFSTIIADKATGGRLQDTVETTLEQLYAISEDGYQCKFVYGLASYPFIFRITKLTVTEQLKNADGQTIRANIDIQLTESAPYNPSLLYLDVVTFDPPVIPSIKTSSDIPESVQRQVDYLSSYWDSSRAQSLEELYNRSNSREQTLDNLQNLIYGNV